MRRAFFELNKNDDIGKVSVRMLTDRAGISRSLFYIYYSDIYALRAEIENIVLEEMFLGFDGIPMFKSFRTEMPKYNREWIIRLREHRDEISILCGLHGDGAFRTRIVKLRAEMVSNWMFRDEQRLVDAEKQRILNHVALFAAESEISWLVNFTDETHRSEDDFMEFYQVEMFLRENVLQGLENYQHKMSAKAEQIRTETSIIGKDEWLNISSGKPNSDSVTHMQIYTAKNAAAKCLDVPCNLDEITIVPINLKTSNVLFKGAAAQNAKKQGISLIEVTTTIEANYVLSVATAHINNF